MPRIKPYAGTSHARLSTLIKNAQEIVIPNTVTFIFDEPKPDSSSVIGATTVAVVAIASSRVDESVDVSYIRLSVDVLKELPFGELLPFNPMQFPTTTHAILPQLNEALGLNLLPSEVVNSQIPLPPINGITLEINQTSLAWLPGAYTYGYAPDSITAAGRNINNTIPTDERRRLRVLEIPVVS